jgi:hypothetical protein
MVEASGGDELNDLGDVDDVDDGQSDRSGPAWRRWTWLAVGAAVLLLLLVMLGPNFQLPVLTHRPDGPAATLTDADGTRYTLIATASIETWRHTALTITVTPDPTTTVIRIWAACALASGVGKWKRSTMALSNAVDVPGVGPGYDPVFSCSTRGLTSDVDIRMLPRDGPAVRLAFQRWDTTADTPTRWPATWVFGIYQRGTPPGAPTPPRLDVTMPAVLVPDWAPGHHFTLLKQASGVYPGQKSVAVTVPPGHLSIAIASACSAVLQNLTVLYVSVDPPPGPLPTDGNRCGDATTATLNSPVLVKLTPDQVATGVTLVITIRPPTPYQDRTGAWAIGVYVE